MWGKGQRSQLGFGARGAGGQTGGAACGTLAQGRRPLRAPCSADCYHPDEDFPQHVEKAELWRPRPSVAACGREQGLTAGGPQGTLQDGAVAVAAPLHKASPYAADCALGDLHSTKAVERHRMAERRSVAARAQGDCWAQRTLCILTGVVFGFAGAHSWIQDSLNCTLTYSGHSSLPVSNTSKIDKNKQEKSFPSQSVRFSLGGDEGRARPHPLPPCRHVGCRGRSPAQPLAIGDGLPHQLLVGWHLCGRQDQGRVGGGILGLELLDG